ncbi:amidohydrolase [Klebsiella pneumoniae]|uniref:amidohydrolase n=13 Tax=Klebsiella/Raoultella group TaxID=2890311 RepID=UPI0034E2AD86
MKHQHGRESAGMIFIARFMNSFLHQASFATGYWCYDRHRSVRLVVLVGLAIDQIAQSGLSSLSVIYYSAQLFSKHKGCMHGCGHDGHTAMLLGAAELLSANRDFDGTIHLIFQPGEEGGAGARVMMNEGLFKLFPCQAVFALHNWPHLPQGQMGTKIGPIMASGVTFEITVFGKGGHAALPQSTIDPVPVACFIVSHLQTLISRRMNPLDAAVLTIGKIEAGSSPNIIPSEAKIMGTCRTLTNEAQSLILDNMQRIAISIAEAHGAHAEVIIKQGGYPNTNNHPKEARFMAKMMREIVGENNAHDNVLPAMTAEDFGFMLQEVPGAYGWIGNGNDALSQGDLHSTSYDFNDKNLELGALFWEKLARQWFITEVTHS